MCGPAPLPPLATLLGNVICSVKNFDEFIAGVLNAEGHPAVIQRLQDALQDCQNPGANVAATIAERLFLPLCRPTIREVSERFHLNTEQHLAFFAAGKPLLEEFLEEAKAHAENRAYCWEGAAAKLRMHLPGAAGTGKSTVIRALQAMAKAWGEPGAVRTAAPTGNAAVQIHGVTLHKLLRIPVMRRGDECDDAVYLPLSGSPTKDQLKRLGLGRMRLLIIDECSMVSLELLGRVNYYLQVAKGVSTVSGSAFGGVNVMLAGDFFQLPPVMAKALYDTPCGLPDVSEYVFGS